MQRQSGPIFRWKNDLELSPFGPINGSRARFDKPDSVKIVSLGQFRSIAMNLVCTLDSQQFVAGNLALSCQFFVNQFASNTKSGA